MADESRNWQWNQSRDHGPDRPNKEQRENQTNKPVENSREVLTDIPETRNLGSMVMKCLETKRTNRSSGSLNEAQEHSIEIDFGDGKTASRKSSLTEAQATVP